MSDDTTIDALIVDPHNRRKHTPRNLDMIAASLRAVGAGRSIVIDERGEVLAGNGVLSAARDAGISKVQVVDVDGDTIVAVRRRGLSDAQKRDLAMFDNRTAELPEWDVAQLQSDVDAGLALEPFFFPAELEKLGVKVPTFNAADLDAQGVLSSTKPITCPQCGHEFTR